MGCDALTTGTKGVAFVLPPCHTTFVPEAPTMFTYNDLLIDILNMTPEERKQDVMVTTSATWAPECADKVGEVYRHFDDVYLLKS